MLDAQAVAPTAGEGGAMDDGVGGTEEAEQELLAALAPVEENKATDAENPPLQTGPPLFSIVLKSTNGTLTARFNRFSAVTRIARQ